MALAACLSRMGSSVQLFSYGAQPEGFVLEISSFDEPSKEWLNEWLRQASLLMKEDWPFPVEMTSENLKLFWKQKGQYLRSRQLQANTLVPVVCWPGFIELFICDEMALQPLRFDSLVLLGVKSVNREIKGHQEKLWLIQGRVAPTSQARKVLSKLKPVLSCEIEPLSLVLKASQMQDLMKVQALWIEELKEEPSLNICLRQKIAPKSKNSKLSVVEGWSWVREKIDEIMGYLPLWLEPEFESLSLNQVGLKDKVEHSLSFLLRIICKIAKILQLEVSCSLRASSHPAMRSWLDIFEAESFCSLSLIEEESNEEKPQLVWQMSVCSDRVTWWPLAELTLSSLEKAKWQLRAKPVISFYRWAAAIKK